VNAFSKLIFSQEKRMIVSLDMHEMNQIKWIDYHSLMACIESGVIGKDLDEKLAKLGLCIGHEPDSSEWSSLGGWVATRASGLTDTGVWKTYSNKRDEEKCVWKHRGYHGLCKNGHPTWNR
jgi:FAD/FMN-containing dehydrogenase